MRITWFIETLWGGRIPDLRPWASMLAGKVFSSWVHYILVFIFSWAWIEFDCCFLEFMVERCPFRIVNRSHGPLWRLVIPKLVISTWSWKFDPIQFNIASRSSHLHSYKILIFQYACSFLYCEICWTRQRNLSDSSQEKVWYYVCVCPHWGLFSCHSQDLNRVTYTGIASHFHTG